MPFHKSQPESTRTRKKHSEGLRILWVFFGAEGRNRTTDTGIFSPLLYRLSYLGPHYVILILERSHVNGFPNRAAKESGQVLRFLNTAPDSDHTHTIPADPRSESRAGTAIEFVLNFVGPGFRPGDGAG